MKNKTLLILGASSDVGLEYIKRNEQAYTKIVAHYFSNKEELEKIKGIIGDKIILCQGDFSNKSGTEEFIKFMKENAIIPNHIIHLPAIKVKTKRFNKENWDNMEDELSVQLYSIYRILQEYLPIMKKEKYGKIVLMISSYIINEPPKYCSNYVTIKYALYGLMKALATEYAEDFITINAISPSMMKTKFLDDTPEIVIEKNKINSPLKRLVEIKDVLPVIKLLLDDESQYITGQNIVISGGNNI